jgi:hypothetical protein
VRRCILPPSSSTSQLRYESRFGRVNFDTILIFVHSCLPPVLIGSFDFYFYFELQKKHNLPGIPTYQGPFNAYGRCYKMKGYEVFIESLVLL